MLRNVAAILFVSLFLCASELLSFPHLTGTFTRTAQKLWYKKILSNLSPADRLSILIKSGVSPDLIFISPVLETRPVLNEMIEQRVYAEEQFKNYIVPSAVTNGVLDQAAEILIGLKVWEYTIKGIEQIIQEYQLLSDTDIELSELMESRLGAVSLLKPLTSEPCAWLQKHFGWEIGDILIGEYGVPYEMSVIGNKIKHSTSWELLMRQLIVALNERQADPELMVDEFVRYLWATYRQEIIESKGLDNLRKRLEKFFRRRMLDREAGTLVHHISSVVSEMQTEISEQPFSGDSFPLKFQLDLVWKPALKINWGNLENRNIE